MASLLKIAEGRHSKTRPDPDFRIVYIDPLRRSVENDNPILVIYFLSSPLVDWSANLGATLRTKRVRDRHSSVIVVHNIIIHKNKHFAVHFPSAIWRSHCHPTDLVIPTNIQIAGSSRFRP